MRTRVELADLKKEAELTTLKTFLDKNLAVADQTKSFEKLNSFNDFERYDRIYIEV